MSIVFMDQFGLESLRRTERLLAGIPGGVERAARNAMTRAVSTLRSSTTKEIQKHYDIAAKNLRNEENVRISYSYHSGVTANVQFSGYKIPLYRYGGSSPREPMVDTGKTVNAMVQGAWRKVHPGVAAAGHQMRATAPTRLERGFVARMKSGHVGIFERTGGASSTGGDAIREIMGSSVPQMLGNKVVEEALAREAAHKFEERLEHEVNRLLAGLGGR